MTYIFDEPSTGLHPRDVHRMNKLLISLRDKGNTVLVVEHDKDVISIADEVVDVGPLAGKNGGEIVFQGSYEELLVSSTLTAKALTKKAPINECPRLPTGFLPIRKATLHNLKNIDADIPLNVMTVVTGVAGSGKSTLISHVFAKQYADKVIAIDQSPITANNRSMPATFLGFFDEIRKLVASANKVDAGLLSFNSNGACPVCHGKGVIVTELVFMDPIVTECEACGGKRYSKESLACTYKGKDIIEILGMTALEAKDFFQERKITKALDAMCEVGLSYMTLGQPLSTLSGGERQRIKLAKYLDKKGNIYIFDEPTTGLHGVDVDKIVKLFKSLVEKRNTVVIIEHNIDVIKQADYLIDIGPDGGKNGGELVFSGTPQQMAEASQTITAQCLRANLLNT
jgi:excinuclease UvrABC ATPase subunit